MRKLCSPTRSPSPPKVPNNSLEKCICEKCKFARSPCPKNSPQKNCFCCGSPVCSELSSVEKECCPGSVKLQETIFCSPKIKAGQCHCMNQKPHEPPNRTCCKNRSRKCTKPKFYENCCSCER